VGYSSSERTLFTGSVARKVGTDTATGAGRDFAMRGAAFGKLVKGTTLSCTVTAKGLGCSLGSENGTWAICLIGGCVNDGVVGFTIFAAWFEASEA
jgi:hypothetical protein